MVQEKKKAPGAEDDETRLYGPANDPRVSEEIDRFAGPDLDAAISRIDALSNTLGGDGEDGSPFPFGLKEAGGEDAPSVGNEPAREAPRQDQVRPSPETDEPPRNDVSSDLSRDDIEAADGLDQMLDDITEGPLPGPGHSEPVEGTEEVPTEDSGETAETVSPEEQDTDVGDSDDAVGNVDDFPQSPIGAVLARTTVPENEADKSVEFYDPGLPGDVEKNDEDFGEDMYDPMDLLDNMPAPDHEGEPDDERDDNFDDPEEDQTVSSGLPEPSPMGGMNGFPEVPDVEDHAEDDIPGQDREESDVSRDTGLPEPSPMGDMSAMSGFPVAEDDTADIEAETDKSEDDSMTTDDTSDHYEDLPDGGELPDDHPVETGSRPEKAPEVKPQDGDNGSALEALFEDEDDDVADKTNDAESDETAGSVPSGDTVPGGDQAGSDPDETVRKGRGRLLMGVAAAAVLVAVGLGGYVYLQNPSSLPFIGSSPQVAVTDDNGSGNDIDVTPLPDPDTASQPDEDTTKLAPDNTAADADGSEEEGRPDLPDPATPTEDAAASGSDELGDLSALLDEEDENAESADADVVLEDDTLVEDAAETSPEKDVTVPGNDPLNVDPGQTEPAETPSDIADLQSEIDDFDEPENEALVERIETLEAALPEIRDQVSDGKTRRSEIGDEMTGFSEQVSGLVERDTAMLDRLDRLERLIRGQNAILAQFGKVEENLDQTQIVLLDVSSRIGELEERNPADRDAVNRALSDMENRLDSLSANMSILARMSVEGVQSLQAGGSSAGNAGVRTSDTPEPRANNDTVYQEDSEGFTISSDAAGNVPDDVAKDDFVEGYGYVLDVLPASEGQRLVVMENGSVLISGPE